ncbi:MAG: tyrosine-type recombinase/integrase, partial [Gemmatimonadota bacterium]|nr:tyrosine-type recombinase/integrase [Gemmatimonadota bacterium]
SFVLRYRAGGRRHRLLTLGRYGALTVQQARERARRALVEVGDGSDPLEERRSGRKALTVAELTPIYLERHAKREKRSWKEDVRRLDRYVLPALGSRKLEAVTRQDVQRLHADISETAPTEANRTLALVSVIYSKAAEWGYLADDAPNPTRRVKPNRERSRDRWVNPAELPRLLVAIDAEEDPYAKAAFKLYLLTGLRRSELLGLEWRNVDFELRTVYLPQTKANRPHTVPLSQPAVKVLRELPRMLRNPYVFPGRGGVGHLHDLKRSWARVRKAAELEDVRLHDLRRTVGSMLAVNGASLPLIGKLLNHSNSKTTQVYARFHDDPVRAALEAHAARIAAAGVPGE